MNTNLKKEQYQKDLKAIKSMSARLRGLNESIMFEGDDEFTPEDDMMNEPMPEQEPMQKQEPEIETGVEAQGEMPVDDTKPEDKGMQELDKMGELDQIRKITLQGMLKFSNQPEHPQFQALQKIFQLCNKAVDTDKENNNQQSY